MAENKKLSIVFITNNWLPFNAGVVSSISAYRQELERQGHRVTLITLDFQGIDRREPGVMRVYCPFKYIYKGIPLSLPVAAHRQVACMIKELKPDIIHSHHPFLLGISALNVAKSQKIPCIFTYHTLYEKYTHYVPLPQNILKKLVQNRVKEYCTNVDGIIAPGNYIKRLLELDNITTQHIVLPSPLQQLYVQNIGVRDMQCAPRAKPFHLMTCSRFVKEKNIPFLLEMFSGLDQTQYTFTLAGFGNEQHALESYAYDSLQLSPNMVKFACKLEKNELQKLYQSADLFIFSSLAETQGIVLAEAMASGLPVVALHGPGQEDIVVNGKNGFLVLSLQEMRAAIKMIAQDSCMYQSLCSNAFKTAQWYVPEELTKRLVAFYRTFLV